MRRSRREGIYLLLGIVLLTITLGYAYLQSNLSINGTTNVSSASWNIYWDNIQFGSNNITDVNTPATIDTGKTEVSFNVNFKEPGDTYEFTVDAVNDGTIDAMIDVVSTGVYAINGTTPKTLPDYLEYTVTYSDGVEIAPNQLLASGDTETYKVRVHYKEDITASQLPSTADNYVFKFSVTYKQSDGNAVKPVPDPESFSTDSWPTIIRAVKNNNISAYHVGDTKTIDMGTFGTHTLRIANMSTPSECSTEDFSQTACGFVLEFADIITNHKMNPYEESGTLGNGSIGGWPASELRTYVNSDIYNVLPSELKSGIIDTIVVSGHGETSGETNYTSTDKLFLLSVHEVWEKEETNSINNHDTDWDQTRQLDYYSNLGVTTSNYSGAIKLNNGSSYSWWLRSPDSALDSDFSVVVSDGRWYSDTSHYPHGVSPAFRIG